jgi:hypothetical protein
LLDVVKEGLDVLVLLLFLQANWEVLFNFVDSVLARFLGPQQVS